MSSIASLGRMVSGMMAAQMGLQVTSHNISNANTHGYTRQQLLQHDSRYRNIGDSTMLKQVGLGVSMTEIRQIRDEFADKRYRTQNSILNFYTTKKEGMDEVEAILDEPHGESISKFLDDFWGQMQKLNLNPSGVEERKSFIQTAFVFAEKANNVMDGFVEYQHHLDKQVRDEVGRINEILNQIKDYNEVISRNEVGRENANDLRDQRNVLLDNLSGYMDIEYYEDPAGMVVVKGAGRTLVDKQFVTEMALEQTVPNSPFVKPVWKDTREDVYRMDKEISAEKDNDDGKLKALLIMRGEAIANKDTTWNEIAINDRKSVDDKGNAYILPKLQKELAMFINELTDTINKNLNGFGMGDFKEQMGVPVFVPIKMPDQIQEIGADGNPTGNMIASTPPQLVDPTDPTQVAAYNTAMERYTRSIKPYLIPTNIQVNPALQTDDGYNRLGTTTTVGEVGDNSKVTQLLNEWSKTREWPAGGGAGGITAPKIKHTNFTDFYAEYVADIGTEGYEAKNKVKEKEMTTLTADNERQAMGAVSQDEELTSMLKYQYAYNAATRMINVLDGMMDTIINKM